MVEPPITWECNLCVRYGLLPISQDGRPDMIPTTADGWPFYLRGPVPRWLRCPYGVHPGVEIQLRVDSH